MKGSHLVMSNTIPVPVLLNKSVITLKEQRVPTFRKQSERVHLSTDLHSRMHRSSDWDGVFVFQTKHF